MSIAVSDKQTTLEVTLTPADFGALKSRDLSKAVCVVFDILRATSSMTNALANGAKAIIPVCEIAEAVSIKRKQPDVMLAGERDGVRIRAAQSGGFDFDFGNSPREFPAEKVSGHTIVWTTTNGTRALQACVGSKHIFVGSFANLSAIATWLQKQKPAHLILVGAGTYEESAYEDTLAVGALADLVWDNYQHGHITDSAQIARQIYRACGGDLLRAMDFSRNAQRLLANPDLHDDVAVSLRRDIVDLLAELKDGRVEKTAYPRP